MKHTKHIGFLVGPNIRVASPTRYENDVKSIAGLEGGSIEIRKKNTFERDIKSKVFMIYAVETKSKEIDFKL